MRITVHVRTNTSKQEVVRLDALEYKVYLHSVPEAGKANKELIILLKKHFKKDIRILSGMTKKTKLVEVV